MNIVSALISTVIFGIVFGIIIYFLERRKGGTDAMTASVRQAIIASVVFFLVMIILQLAGYA